MSPIVSGGASGGSQSGVAIVRGPFAIAFDTPGLTNGVPFYAPTVGDLIYDIIIFVDTIWNGTSPLLDIGTFVGTTAGLRTTPGDPMPLDQAASESAGAGLLHGPFVSRDYMSTFSQAGAGLQDAFVPDLVTAANPLKVVVSQTARVGGADPGSTQGAARIYLITATPVAL